VSLLDLVPRSFGESRFQRGRPSRAAGHALDFDAMRQAGSGLGAGGFAVFDASACMVQAAWRYSRFLFVESCGQCPACKFGTGEVTQALQKIEAGGGSDRDLELVLVRAFGDEFGRHVGTPCPLPRELPFHKIVDWDAAAGRVCLRPGVRKQASRRDVLLLTGTPQRARTSRRSTGRAATT